MHDFVPDAAYPQFGSRDVSRATGVSAVSLKNWLRNASPDMPHNTSRRLQFSFRDVVRIQIRAHLVNLGHSHQVADLAATTFADTNFAVGQMATRRDDDYQPLRQVGRLFPSGETYLVVAPEGSRRRPVRVVNVTASKSLEDGLEGAPVVSVVHVNAVWSAVESGLGLPVGQIA